MERFKLLDQVIAIALMYLASKLSKFEVKDWKNRTPEHKSWWDQYVRDLDTKGVLEDIGHQVRYKNMCTRSDPFYFIVDFESLYQRHHFLT